MTAAAIAGGALSALYLAFAIGAFSVTADHLAEPGLWLLAAIGVTGAAAALGSRRHRLARLGGAGLHVALAVVFVVLAIRGWRASSGRYGIRPTELLTLALAALEIVIGALCAAAARRR